MGSAAGIFSHGRRVVDFRQNGALVISVFLCSGPAPCKYRHLMGGDTTGRGAVDEVATLTRIWARRHSSPGTTCQGNDQ